MCGKFTQMASWAEVHAYSSLLSARKNDDEERTFTPMRSVPVSSPRARSAPAR